MGWGRQAAELMRDSTSHSQDWARHKVICKPHTTRTGVEAVSGGGTNQKVIASHGSVDGQSSTAQALPGSSESTPNGRVPGAEHMIEFSDRLGNNYRIVSTDMSSEEMERARQVLLDFVDMYGGPPPGGVF